MNNLSKQMQERLDAWRKKLQPVPSVQKVFGNYVARRRDFGDDMADLDQKEREKNREHYAAEKRVYGK